MLKRTSGCMICGLLRVLSSSIDTASITSLLQNSNTHCCMRQRTLSIESSLSRHLQWKHTLSVLLKVMQYSHTEIFTGQTNESLPSGLSESRRNGGVISRKKMMAGKGDKQRPMKVDRDTYSSNWDKIFVQKTVLRMNLKPSREAYCVHVHNDASTRYSCKKTFLNTGVITQTHSTLWKASYSVEFYEKSS